jgi:hypothetical protein
MSQDPSYPDSSRHVPRDEGFHPPRDDDWNEHGAAGTADTFTELVNELNRHLLQLEYALLDLKEVLVQCDPRESGKLEQQAVQHIDRIRSSARRDAR